MFLKIATFDLRNPEGIYHSLILDRHGSQADEHVTGIQEPLLTGNAVNVFDGFIGGNEPVVIESFHPPEQVELGEDLLVGGKDQDVGTGPPGRNLKGRIPAVGEGGDSLGLDLIGHQGGMVAD